MARAKNCGKCNKAKSRCKCGRPTKITPEVIDKLEEAFSISCTDDEACIHAGIAPATLYKYQRKNPEFAERKEALKLRTNLLARKTIVANMTDVGTAKWWAERKMEFAPKSKIEHSGNIGQGDDEDSKATEAVREEYEGKLRDTIVRSHDNKPKEVKK